MATREPKAAATRAYRAALGALRVAHPNYSLKAFEPPSGTTLVAEFLEKTWGHKAPGTYRARLSMLHRFFEWHLDAGNLAADPTTGLTYPYVERTPRQTLTRAQTKTLLNANPSPRDQVPLRLLLTLGMQKGRLQKLRFRDLDVARRTVTFERRGELHASPVEDDDFWDAVANLVDLRRAAPSDYVLCFERSRVYVATAAELYAMEQEGALYDGRAYLWQRRDGRWNRAVLTPTLGRGDHGAHDWWYRCADRAGLVPPGVTRGFPMQSARFTVGRRRWTKTGSISDLAEHMGGLRSGGSAAIIYRNRDADSLDAAIRRTRRRMRLETRDQIAAAMRIDGTPPVARWWKEPVRVFADYVEDERDLVELSRVSVEMLRRERATSRQLHDAAETLTRAVTAAALVGRAKDESRKDHPLLHGHSLVAIWSALETMIGDLIEAWLLSWPPSRMRAASVVSVSGLHGLPPDEWAAGVRQALDRDYQKLNRKVRSPRRLDYYEWLLDAVGLVANPQDNNAQIAQNLWEMQQIRNAFAHKRGTADARLISNCPRLRFKLKDEIRIDRHAWADFLVTAVLYADVIVRRMKREVGLSDWLRTSPTPAIRYPHLDGR